jgi:hypothetical protein
VTHTTDLNIPTFHFGINQVRETRGTGTSCGGYVILLLCCIVQCRPDKAIQRGLTDLDVTVKVIGVWDTVGSLGLPRISVLTRIGLQSDQSKEMSFYDTKLADCVENAFQALGLDERRTSFSPAVWEKPVGNRTVSRAMSFSLSTMNAEDLRRG